MPKKSKKPTKNPPKNPPKNNVNADCLSILVWFKKEIKHGSPCEICFQCRVSILNEEDPQKHQSHIKYTWNAGHNPIQSKAVMGFIDTLLKLYENYV